MKKLVGSTMILMGIACAQQVRAQSQVQIYGIVDSGVVYTTNVNAAGDSAVKMPGLTGSFPSRFGFKGSEDLGGGVQALFVLESGFALDTGTMGQGNRLFGRQSYVGLKNNYGTLMFGRQVNMTYLVTLKSDVMGPNLFSISSLDSNIPNARSDNAIGYLGKFAGLTVGATYSFGRDTSSAGGAGGTGCAGEVAGNAKACRQVTGLLAYDGKNYGVSGSYDIMYGNTGAAGGLTSSDNSDERSVLSGYAMLGDTKLGMGVMARKKRAAAAVNTDSNLYFLGLSHPLNALLVLDAQLAQLDIKDTSSKSTLSVVRLTYNLSKRTALHASVGHIRNAGAAAIALDVGGTVGAGLNQSGVFTGVRHTF